MCFLCFLPMSDRAPVPAPRARPRPCGAASGPGQASGGRERGPRDPAPRGRGTACAQRREAPSQIDPAAPQRARPSRSRRAAAGWRAAGAEAGERACRARREWSAGRGGPSRLEVALHPEAWGRSPARGWGQGGVHRSEIPVFLSASFPLYLFLSCLDSFPLSLLFAPASFPPFSYLFIPLLPF